MVPVALAAVLTLAGCGGKTTYKLQPTKACLAKQSGLKLRPVVRRIDFVAYSATRGAISVLLRKNEVTISFGENEAEAQRLAAGYRRFRGKNIGIEDVLKPKNNAVMLWKAHPSVQDLSTIDNCLK